MQPDVDAEVIPANHEKQQTTESNVLAPVKACGDGFYMDNSQNCIDVC